MQPTEAPLLHIYMSSYTAASSRPGNLRKGAVCIWRRSPRTTRIFSSEVLLDLAEMMPKVTRAVTSFCCCPSADPTQAQTVRRGERRGARMARWRVGFEGRLAHSANCPIQVLPVGVDDKA